MPPPSSELDLSFPFNALLPKSFLRSGPPRKSFLRRRNPFYASSRLSRVTLSQVHPKWLTPPITTPELSRWSLKFLQIRHDSLRHQPGATCGGRAPHQRIHRPFDEVEPSQFVDAAGVDALESSGAPLDGEPSVLQALVQHGAARHRDEKMQRYRRQHFARPWFAASQAAPAGETLQSKRCMRLRWPGGSTPTRSMKTAARGFDAARGQLLRILARPGDLPRRPLHGQFLQHGAAGQIDQQLPRYGRQAEVRAAGLVDGLRRLSRPIGGRREEVGSVRVRVDALRKWLPVRDVERDRHLALCREFHQSDVSYFPPRPMNRL